MVEETERGVTLQGGPGYSGVSCVERDTEVGMTVGQGVLG